MGKRKTRVSSNIPADETKSARFVRVVSPRVTKAVKAITVIGFCSGATYEYTPGQIKQIIDVLAEALGNLNERFVSKQASAESFAFKA